MTIRWKRRASDARGILLNMTNAFGGVIAASLESSTSEYTCLAPRGQDPSGHDVIGVDGVGAALPPAKFIKRRVRRDPMHPGGDRGATVEAADGACDLDQGFLGRVERVVRTADSLTHRVNAIEMPREQRVECGAVAVGGGPCECRVVARVRRVCHAR